jgi:hypothetical protein
MNREATLPLDVLMAASLYLMRVTLKRSAPRRRWRWPGTSTG